MPNQESFGEKLARQARGEFQVGELVAQDYKMKFGFIKQSYISEQKAEELLGKTWMDSMRTASKIIRIIISDDKVQIGVMFRSSNPNKDEDHTDWSVWRRDLVYDATELSPEDAYTDEAYEKAISEGGD